MSSLSPSSRKQALKAYICVKPGSVNDPQAPIVVALANMFELTLVKQWDTADLIMYFGTVKDQERRLCALPCGLLGRARGHLRISMKDALAQHLRSTSPQTMFTIVPWTLVVAASQDATSRRPTAGSVLAAYEAEAPKQLLTLGRDWFICKMPNLWGGEAIKICRNQQELETAMAGLAGVSFVVQKYIEQPLLWRGHKFDLRLYVLTLPVLETRQGKSQEIAAFGQEIAENQHFVFYGGHVRLSVPKFTLDSAEPNIHLTNQCIQRNDSSMQTVYDVYDLMEELNITETLLFKQVERQMKAVLAGPPMATSRAQFQLWGIDVMLDVERNTWLLEVNYNPGTTSEDLRAITNKQALWTRVFELTFANRTGQPLPEQPRKYGFHRI